MDQDNGDVVNVSKVSQLGGEVDVTRYEDDGGGGGVGVSEPTQTLTELVVSSVLSNGIDVNQSDLEWKHWEGLVK